MAQSLQQPDSGRSRGGPRGPVPPPPLFLDPTEVRRAQKFFGETVSPLLPRSL